MPKQDLITRWFEEVWARGRDSAIDEMMAPDAVLHGLGATGQPLTGPAAFRGFYTKFREAFSDIHVTVDDVLTDGDKSVGRFTFTARHTGDTLGFPATGRQVRATGMVITRVRNGQIAESWNEFDFAGVLRQLQGPEGLELRV
jgi:steroid delta-isomerase-like uncharacterized protein